MLGLLHMGQGVRVVAIIIMLVTRGEISLVLLVLCWLLMTQGVTVVFSSVIVTRGAPVVH